MPAEYIDFDICKEQGHHTRICPGCKHKFCVECEGVEGSDGRNYCQVDCTPAANLEDNDGSYWDFPC